jgi:NAD(P)-dependent dehydrogenase (short-subunit alcohol dehydrogenase family)
MESFTGKTVIITGAASGIGKALALYFSRFKTRLIAADIDSAGLIAVADAIRAQGSQCKEVVVDVADSMSAENLIQAAVSAFGRVDYLFTIAGIAAMVNVEELDIEDWQRIVDINILGTVYCSMAAYKVMQTQRSGHIVNMASLAGLIGFPTMTPYAMTKAAIVGFATNLRAEALPYNIHVTVLCPSFIESKIYEHAIVRGLDPQQVRSLVPFSLMPTEKAVKTIVTEVAKKKALVVFPGYAHVLWFLARVFPRIVRPFHSKTVALFRAMQKQS